jgi:hypothetical protein
MMPGTASMPQRSQASPTGDNRCGRRRTAGPTAQPTPRRPASSHGSTRSLTSRSSCASSPSAPPGCPPAESWPATGFCRPCMRPTAPPERGIARTYPPTRRLREPLRRLVRSDSSEVHQSGPAALICVDRDRPSASPAELVDSESDRASWYCGLGRSRLDAPWMPAECFSAGRRVGPHPR